MLETPVSTTSGQFFGVKSVQNFSVKAHKLQVKEQNKQVALSNLEVSEHARILVINLVEKQVFFEDLWVVGPD